MSSTERVIDRMKEPNASRSSDAPELGDGAENIQRLLRRRRQARHRARTIRRPRQLAQQPIPPFRRVGLRRRILAVACRRPPQRLQGFRGARRVLAEIEPHRGEAEDLRGDAHRPHQIDAERAEPRLDQRVLQQLQIVDQLVGIGVSRPVEPDLRALLPHNRAFELAQDQSEELPIGLAGIAKLDRLALPAQLQFLIEMVAEGLRHLACPLRHRQRLQQIDNAGAIALRAKRAHSPATSSA